MALLVRMLKEAAAYWPLTGVDSFGKPVYGAPSAIKVRWEDTNMEVLNAEGEKELSGARVFANLNDLQVRGMLMYLGLFQGTAANMLAQVQDQSDPYNNRDSFGTPLARRIIKFSKMGDLKVRHFLRIAYVN